MLAYVRRWLRKYNSHSEQLKITQHSQSISNVSTVYSDQRPDSDQLLNYQECQRHASMLEKGSQEDVHVKRIVLHTTSS